MSSNQLGRIVTSAMLLGVVGTAEAGIAWPTLPIEDVSVYGTTALPLEQGSRAWDGDVMPGIGVEVGVWLDPSKKDVRDQTAFIDAVVGYTFSSMRGEMSDSLRARASLQETYLGIGLHIEPEGWPIGLFGGANLRLFSLDSGRAYGTTTRERPAYKLGGAGAGAALTGGVAIGDYFYVELSFTSRFVPSVVVDPPSGMLPADVPERMTFHSVGLAAGLSFPFDK